MFSKIYTESTLNKQRKTFVHFLKWNSGKYLETAGDNFDKETH